MRRGEIWMPITVRIGEEERPLESPDEIQVVEVTTSGRAEVVELDPEAVLIDVDRSNNVGEIAGDD